MVQKFNSSVPTPQNENPIVPGGDEDLNVEELGQEVDLQTGQQNPDIIIEDDGSAVLNAEEAPLPTTFGSNLAEVLDPAYLQALANELVEKVDNDKSTREDWEQSYTKGLDLLGFKYEERTRPFRGAASVNHPVLAQAVTQFQAMAYVELLPSDGPVRTQVVGANSPELQQAADRDWETLAAPLNGLVLSSY